LPGDELQVHGSGALAHTLIDNDLVDEYRLLYFPVHLGTGKKLFRDGAKAAALRLVSTSTTSTGVVIATYQPAGPVQTGSYALDLGAVDVLATRDDHVLLPVDDERRSPPRRPAPGHRSETSRRGTPRRWPPGSASTRP